MNKEKQTSVMTPVFEGTRYLHHICSECKGTIKLTQSCYGGASFYEINGIKDVKIKYCQLCGAEISRFSDKPMFLEPLDLTPLDVFAKLHNEYERKAKWLYHCYINNEHREKVDELYSLIQKKEVSVYYQKALDMVMSGRYLYSNNARTIRKLRQEFGESEEEE